MSVNHDDIRALADQLAEIARTKKELKKVEEEAKDKMLKLMKEANLQNVKFEAVTVFTTYRKKWEYSEAVKNLEAEVKQEKEKEEENGTATFTESESLTVKAFGEGE